MKKVHVVPHHHWDREWYFTIEDSNAMLVEHVDFLIEFLEDHKNFPYFVLDGQVSIVEEYLRYRPMMKGRFAKLINEGRIIIGPWYTQSDTLNPKIQSVVRNLQYGIEIGSKYGDVMKIGYLPDVFGQNAYLPSIFKNCKLNYSILQRGIETKDVKSGLSFEWSSPNGDKIKTNYIHFGYGPGKFLKTDNMYVNNKLIPIVDQLNTMSRDNEILLPSGGDQAIIKTDFPRVVKELNNIQSSYNFELSNFELFMKGQNFSGDILGELYCPQKSRIHRTIHSQRMDIKILNRRVEKLLIEKLEPLMVVANRINISVNNICLDEVWKSMFDVHAHDSIAGCNSDETNKRIISRLNEVEAKIEGQINLLSKKIAKSCLGEKNGLLVLNFSNKENKVFKARVFSETKNFLLYDNLKKVEYTKISQKKIEGGFKVEVTATGEKQVPIDDYYQTDIEFTLLGLIFGYKVLEIVETETISQDIKYLETNSIVTNKYNIELSESCIISSGIDTVKLGFEVQSDTGDSYDFSPEFNSKPVIYSNISKVQVAEKTSHYNISFVTNVKCPKGVEMPILSNIIVYKNQDSLEITHDFINKASDYRMRAVLLTEVKAKTHTADSGFGVVERDNVDKNLETWKQQNFAEKPLSVYPFERFVTIDRLSIINSDVKEYEVLKNGVALTLLRCVGVLGKDDLLTRPGRASGINNVSVKTPDAQLQNLHFVIKYNISLDCSNEYSYYNLVTNNSICYQNQNLNVFDNRLDRFDIPPQNNNVYMLNIDLPKELEISNARLNFDNVPEYTMMSTSTKVDVSKMEVYDFIGNRIQKKHLEKNDYIVIRENNEKKY